MGYRGKGARGVTGVTCGYGGSRDYIGLRGFIRWLQGGYEVVVVTGWLWAGHRGETTQLQQEYWAVTGLLRCSYTVVTMWL